MTRTTPARPALLRTLNDRTVLDALLSRGPSSRADLAEISGLSKPTIAEVLSRLEEGGLIIDAGETVGRRGPNGRMHDLALDLTRGAALSVVPGRVDAEVLDARGTVLGTASRTRGSLPRGAAEVTRLLVREAAEQAGVPLESVHEVVIGVPGSYDTASDRVRYADRLPDWTVPGIAAALRSELGDGVEVTLDNDVNLALVAERSAGAAHGANVASLLWLSSGIGLATDLGGTLYRGVSGGAGEIGYIPVPALARPGRGRTAYPDFQDVVGGAAVLRLAREHGVTGRTAHATVEQAVSAHQSDPAAGAFLDELASRIALGLAVIVAVLDPGLVVLGGAVGRAGGRPLAARTAKAFRSVSPLACQILASTVEGDPALAGARSVATARVRDRLLDAANLSALGTRPVREPTTRSQHQLPTPRTAQEVR